MENIYYGDNFPETQNKYGIKDFVVNSVISDLIEGAILLKACVESCVVNMNIYKTKERSKKKLRSLFILLYA